MIWKKSCIDRVIFGKSCSIRVGIENEFSSLIMTSFRTQDISFLIDRAAAAARLRLSSFWAPTPISRHRKSERCHASIKFKFYLWKIDSPNNCFHRGMAPLGIRESDIVMNEASEAPAPEVGWVIKSRDRHFKTFIISLGLDSKSVQFRIHCWPLKKAQKVFSILLQESPNEDLKQALMEMLTLAPKVRLLTFLTTQRELFKH